MNFQGNWVDVGIVVTLFLFALDGWERGIFWLLAQLGSFVGGILIAFRFYAPLAPQVARLLSLPHGLAKAIAFLLLAMGTEALLSPWLYRLASRVPKKYFPRWWRGVLSLGPSLVSGGVLVAFVLSFLVSAPIRPQIKRDIVDSNLGGWFIEFGGTLERNLSGVFGEATKETLTFVTTPVGSGERVDLGFELEAQAYEVDSASEGELLALVNQERAKEGLQTLEWYPDAVSVARSHSEDMLKRGYFSHYSPEGEDAGDRLQKAGIQYRVAGENLALAPSISVAHQGLMDSPGHRANILSPEFSRVSIGVIDGGTYGKMITQIFLD